MLLLLLRQKKSRRSWFRLIIFGHYWVVPVESTNSDKCIIQNWVAGGNCDIRTHLQKNWIPKLLLPTKSLLGPTQLTLKVLGQFNGIKETSGSNWCLWVRNLQRNLLGSPAIISLNLVSRQNSFKCQKREWTKEYPNLFKGLETLEEQYSI